MPVRRLTNLRSAEESLWLPPGPTLWRALAALWRFSERLAPQRFPPGVYRHRSIEAANAQAETWQTAAPPAGRDEDPAGNRRTGDRAAGPDAAPAAATIPAKSVE